MQFIHYFIQLAECLLCPEHCPWLPQTHGLEGKQTNKHVWYGNVYLSTRAAWGCVGHLTVAHQISEWQGPTQPVSPTHPTNPFPHLHPSSSLSFATHAFVWFLCSCFVPGPGHMNLLCQEPLPDSSQATSFSWSSQLKCPFLREPLGHSLACRPQFSPF